MTKKLTAFKLGEQHDAMLVEVSEKLGISKSESIRRGIEMLHGKTFKEYIEVQKARNKMLKEVSPEDKVRMDLNKQDIRKEMKSKKIYDKGLNICQMLEGEVQKYGEGEFNCKFETFEYMSENYVHTGSMNLPFEDLSEELLEIKWKGATKEKILATLKKINDKK